MAEKIKEEKAKTPRKTKAVLVEEPAKEVDEAINPLAVDAPLADETPAVEQVPSDEVPVESEEIAPEVIADGEELSAEAGEIDPEAEKITPEIIADGEGIVPEAGELGAAASQQAEDEEIEAEFDEEDHPHMEMTEETIVSGPAEIATLNPNLPADKSKWVARLVAEKGYHILFKGSFAKAYRVADNYNRIHGFPANKVRRVRS